MTEILKVSNIIYQSVLKYPNITIAKNATTFIKGPSGSGKSTLLKLLNGTITPDSGTLYYMGNKFNQIDKIQLRKDVLLIGQSLYLFQGSIYDNFNEYYRYRGCTFLTKEQMKYFMALCCIDFPLDTSCDTMSGGERQRIYIAICLSFMPKVLMMDEPTSSLDKVTSWQLLHNLKNFCHENEITLLIVSHDLDLIETYGDHIIVVEKEVTQ